MILIKVSLLTSSNAIFSAHCRCRNANARKLSWGCHYYYHYVPWCDDEKSITNPEAPADTPFPNTLPYTTSCCQEKKFSLRDFALWGLHTVLSWEHLWLNSCSLILPSQRSMGRRAPYRLVIHWWHGICLYLFFLSYLCKFYYNGTWAEVQDLEREKGREQKKQLEKVQSTSCHRKWVPFRPWQASAKASVTKVWSVKACHKVKPTPA